MGRQGQKLQLQQAASIKLATTVGHVLRDLHFENVDNYGLAVIIGFLRCRLEGSPVYGRTLCMQQWKIMSRVFKGSFSALNFNFQSQCYIYNSVCPRQSPTLFSSFTHEPMHFRLNHVCMMTLDSDTSTRYNSLLKTEAVGLPFPTV